MWLSDSQGNKQASWASATAGNLSYDFARGRHRTVSAAASRRHVDASLDLFTVKKSPRIWGDLAEKRALRARRPFFVEVLDGGSPVGV